MTKKQSRIWITLLFVLVVLAGIAYTKQYEIRGMLKERNIVGYPMLSENIRLTTPAVGETVSLPFSVTGTARVFESSVAWRMVESGTQRVLATGHTMADAQMGEFGPFRIDINYVNGSLPRNGAIELQVYWNSPKDGSMLDPVIVPLSLEMSSLEQITLYGRPYPETYYVPTIDVRDREIVTIQRTLELMLDTDVSFAGYTIEDLQLENGTVTLSFGPTGAVVLSPDSQAGIEQTLKQFPFVQQVIIK